MWCTRSRSDESVFLQSTDETGLSDRIWLFDHRSVHCVAVVMG